MFNVSDDNAKVMRKEAGNRDIKKAGRFPMREREGPTKNPIPRRQRNAQQK